MKKRNAMAFLFILVCALQLWTQASCMAIKVSCTMHDLAADKHTANRYITVKNTYIGIIARF